MIDKKGFTILEVIVLVVIFGILALFATPIFTKSKVERQEATVRANVSIAASAITSRFALKTEKTSAEKVATESAISLNKTTKNPIIKENDAFSLKAVDEGTVLFVANNKENLVEIKGYGFDTSEPLITKIIHGYND